jgi:RNase adaptor protein for sRNA GlmZ degradation
MKIDRHRFKLMGPDAHTDDVRFLPNPHFQAHLRPSVSICGFKKEDIVRETLESVPVGV